MIDNAEERRRHCARRLIEASPSAIYSAFMNDLVRWLPPEGAVGHIEVFEPWKGGRFRMRLVFATSPGKTAADADVVEATFRRLRPGREIVFDVEFDTDRPEFAGVMSMTWSLAQRDDGTEVTVFAEGVPSGIGKADHERGMRSTLANLAAFLSRV